MPVTTPITKLMPKDARPETGGLAVDFVIPSQRDGFEHDDQGRQAHCQLGEQLVKGDREGEVQAVNQERAIHNCCLARLAEKSIMPGRVTRSM
jgi:hypothetical protein